MRKYGWKPQLPDFRDKKRFARLSPPTVLPPSVDLIPKCPPVYDQGQLGSCTAQGIAAAVEFDSPGTMPSRLFMYYEERRMEGDINQDGGAEIRDGFKVLNTEGICPETLWPYDEAMFAVKPPKKCYRAALLERSVLYESLDNTDLGQLKGCLASGFPFVFGVTVYDSFESDVVAASGIVPMPDSSESVLGGHCMMCVGYDDTTSTFIVRNSWGTSWGQKGYCTMPYAYLTNADLASDFWTVEKLTSQDPFVAVT